jgi:succinyl-CoA synthetase beta subunit
VARLHEYQGKALLKQHGIAVPEGGVARSAEEAREIARRLGGRVILKVQAWITGRKSKGGVVFADSPDLAAQAAARLLAMRFGNFPVTDVLIEGAIDIAHELFVSLSIDDAARSPVLLLDAAGGTGIEDRASTVARLPVDIARGVDPHAVTRVLHSSPIPSASHDDIARTIATLIEIARQHEARSLEINPLVVTRSGEVIAADCRMTIDDYAVFRHPDLGIEIARELDHPPTDLERIAYQVEQKDHRGTFYFAQLPFDTERLKSSRGLIGFHGAGGGGSMMSMDAASSAGFTLANFCDTSGNPSAAKVYRAARIILAQPGLVGYFGSGSGVASQEQFWSAYGLAKAFIELNLDIPAVIRLGGNSEDRAVEILRAAAAIIGAPIEGYRKDDTPGKCAARFAELVQQSNRAWQPRPRSIPGFVGSGAAYSFAINAGRVWIDHEACDRMSGATDLVVQHSGLLLKRDERGRPVLAVSEADIAGKDSEMIALEIECRRALPGAGAGKRIVFVDLPVPGLDDDEASTSENARSELDQVKHRGEAQRRGD